MTAAPRPTGGASPGDDRPKKLLIVGAGAVGSFLGTLLGSVGYEVTLVRIFEPPSEKPVTLVRPDGTRVVVPVHRVSRTEDASRPDLILVAVKMPALREALVPTLEWPDAPTLTVENGIGAEEIAAEVRTWSQQIAGSLTAPIRLASEDEVQWLGRGGVRLSAHPFQNPPPFFSEPVPSPPITAILYFFAIIFLLLLDLYFLFIISYSLFCSTPLICALQWQPHQSALSEGHAIQVHESH